MKILSIASMIIGLFVSIAGAADPFISIVTGEQETGGVLEIKGKNMLDEKRAKWLPLFKSGSAYGFEGTGPRTDDLCSAGFCMGSYDHGIRLSGGKSAIFSVAGISGPYPEYVESFNGIDLHQQDFFGRTYFRYTNNSGVWPDNALKFIVIQGKTNSVYIQPVGSADAPDSFRVVDNGKNYFGKIPGGAIKSDRWYLLEWEYCTSAKEVKVWIDNQLIITAPLTTTTQNYLEYGIVNAFSTPPQFALTLRMDNMALSASRIYPSSLIEISDSSTYGKGKVKYQEPLYLSNEKIKIKVDLHGLGDGPYYLWITNNSLGRSVPYKLGKMKGKKAGAATLEEEPMANQEKPLPPEVVKVSKEAMRAVPPPSPPVVLLHERFDDNGFERRGWYDNTDLKLSISGRNQGSGRCAEFKFTEGAVTPVSGKAMRKLFAGSDSVYISYWQKYSDNWKEQSGGAGHHEIYLLTNKDSPHTNLAFTRLTTYLESWGTFGKIVALTPQVSFQDGANIRQNSVNTDLSGISEDRAAHGCNGQFDKQFWTTCYNAGKGQYWNGKFLPGKIESFALGKWSHVELYLKLNSIIDGKGVADGIVTLWLDGQQLLSHNNVLLRTGKYPDMKFNQIVIAPFMGNGSPADQTFWLDDLLVTSAPPVHFP